MLIFSEYLDKLGDVEAVIYRETEVPDNFFIHSISEEDILMARYKKNEFAQNVLIPIPLPE